MTDFWLSCGHHLLDRDGGGGLLVTDEFLKAYLARPELAPPPDACIAERTLHAALLTNPRRPVAASEIATIADADARENWTVMTRVPRPSHQSSDRGSRLSRSPPPRRGCHAAPVHQSTRACDPAQRARRLRRRLHAAGRGALVPAAAPDRARRFADRGRRGDDRGRRNPSRSLRWSRCWACRLPARSTCSMRSTPKPTGNAAICSTWRSISRPAGAGSTRLAM